MDHCSRRADHVVMLVGFRRPRPPPVAPPIKDHHYGDITGLAPFPEHEFQTAWSRRSTRFNASGGVQGRKIDLSL